MSDRRSRVLQALVTVTVVAAALTGCASSSPTTPSSSTTSPAAASTTAGSAAGGSTGATTTLVGTVQEGVESGCVVLVGADGKVLANLLGLDTAAAPVGSEVEVTGMFEADMMTTCQQGEPFTVTAVEVG
jgi:hypothetical protein